MIGYADLKWKNDKLYAGKKYTSVHLKRNEKYDFMYWVCWDFNGPEITENFYNITNAHDNGKRIYLRYINNSTENGTCEARTAI